jgi:2-oxoglutarate dehydrogenase E2 component (dihydrolipoamide succinyltransferase)
MNRVPAMALAIVTLAVAGVTAGCASPAEKADRAIIRERRDPGAEAIGTTRVARPGKPAAAATLAAPERPVAGRGPGLSVASSSPAPAQVAQGNGGAGAQAAPVTAGQKRNGLVIAVRGESVYVDLGRGDGVVVGQRLHVVRPGAPLVHPVTSETLGSVDDEVAQLEVTVVAEKSATTRVVRVEDGAAIEPKDRVVAGAPPAPRPAAAAPASPGSAAAPPPTAAAAPASPAPAAAPASAAPGAVPGR